MPLPTTYCEALLTSQSWLPTGHAADSRASDNALKGPGPASVHFGVNFARTFRRTLFQSVIPDVICALASWASSSSEEAVDFGLNAISPSHTKVESSSVRPAVESADSQVFW